MGLQNVINIFLYMFTPIHLLVGSRYTSLQRFRCACALPCPCNHIKRDYIELGLVPQTLERLQKDNFERCAFICAVSRTLLGEQVRCFQLQLPPRLVINEITRCKPGSPVVLAPDCRSLSVMWPNPYMSHWCHRQTYHMGLEFT